MILCLSILWHLAVSKRERSEALSNPSKASSPDSKFRESLQFAMDGTLYICFHNDPDKTFQKSNCNRVQRDIPAVLGCQYWRKYNSNKELACELFCCFHPNQSFPTLHYAVLCSIHHVWLSFYSARVADWKGMCGAGSRSSWADRWSWIWSLESDCQRKESLNDSSFGV